MPFLVSDLPSHPNLMRAQWLGNSRLGRYPNSSPQPSCFTATRRPNHQASPLSSALVGAVISCPSNRQRTIKREKSGRLGHFPRVMEGTKHDKSCILSQYPDHGLFYSIVLPPSSPAERISCKRSAYTEEWGGDLKLQVAVLLALQVGVRS